MKIRALNILVEVIFMSMNYKRPIIIEGNIGYVTLTQGRVAIIDAEDAEEVGKHNWCYKGRGYARSQINNKLVFLHNFLMDSLLGTEIDHINNNGIDCRKNNMRLCTHIENLHNQNIRSNNTSGCKGVMWHTQRKKWYARITVNYKCISLGLFSNIEEAAQAYREASMKYHGEFARF
jgi:hypothetical protein